jgi:hypothetical protein
MYRGGRNLAYRHRSDDLYMGASHRSERYNRDDCGSQPYDNDSLYCDGNYRGIGGYCNRAGNCEYYTDFGNFRGHNPFVLGRIGGYTDRIGGHDLYVGT